MKKALLAFVLASQAQANIITSSVQVGDHIEISGVFATPQFDPSRGILDSLTFDVWLNGSLTWETVSRDHWGIAFTDFNILTSTTFLGSTSAHLEDPVFGWGGLPCGTALYPAACSDTNSKFTNGNFHVVRTVTGDALNTFIGTGWVDSPIVLSIDARPAYTPGVQIGGLLAYNVTCDGYGTYGYTAAPEPRLFWLLLMVVAVGGLAKACWYT